VNTDTYDDQLLTEFLLGAASEEDTEHLDELSITDDALASRLSAVEHDLVDAYVSGELSGTTLERFDSHYLSSPRRQQRVRFAQTFQQLTEKADIRRETRVEGSKPGFASRFFAAPRLAFGWGFAAASLLILVAVGYLLLENARMRASLTSAQAERTALQQHEQELQRQLDQQRSTLDQTTKELEGERQSLAEAENQLAASGPSSATDQEFRLSFVLLPPLRSAGPVPEFHLQASTRYVDVKMVFEADDFQSYRVTLKNPATNQPIWQSRALRPVSKGQRESVSVSLSAGSLKPQTYFLELTGIGSSGAVEAIGTYPFKVVLQ
jgi:hypothetical protein